MSNPPDRSRPQVSPVRKEGPAPGLLAGEEGPLPAVSRGEAAAYIGEMAVSLRRIAEGSDLPELARLLAGVEAEAQTVREKAQSRRGAG